MNRTTWYVSCVIAVLLVAFSALAYAQVSTKPTLVAPAAGELKFRFSTIDAAISSIQFPPALLNALKGIRETGPMTATAAPPPKSGTQRLSVVNTRTGKGSVVWSVKITAPFLDKLYEQRVLKQKELLLDFVGTVSLDVKTGSMTCVDVAQIPADFWPGIGTCAIKNTNHVKKTAEAESKGGVSTTAYAFSPLADAKLSATQEKELTDQAFRSAGITLSAKVLEGFAAQRVKTPTQELTIYFEKTGTFASAGLKGSAVMEIVK
jgi:hypothetical protein